VVAVAEFVYNAHKLRVAQGVEQWGTDDYRLLLLTTDVEDPTDVSVADLISGGAVEAAHASYGRVALTGEAAALVAAVAEMDANDTSFGALTGVTPVASVVYRHVDGTNANDLLVSHHDTGFGAPANGAGYTVAWPNEVLHLS
jgi:hypothetical protein